MRFLTVSFVLYCLICPFFSQGQSADETALKNLIDAETAAFTKMSFADVGKTYWLLDEKTLLNVSLPGGTILQENTEDILSETETPPAGHATVVKSNYHFIIQNNMAAAYYDQVVTITETGDKIYSSELHIFHKVDGVWKIHLSSVHQYMR